MKKILSLAFAALLAGTMTVTAIGEANAHFKGGIHHRHGRGAGVAAGIIGGLIVGGAIANANRRGRNRHCHYDYCHRHSYRYSDHVHEDIVYERPRRRPRRRPVARSGDAHEDWCYRKYRSYRAYDNTYQPYSGGRRYCRSPYG